MLSGWPTNCTNSMDMVVSSMPWQFKSSNACMSWTRLSEDNGYISGEPSPLNSQDHADNANGLHGSHQGMQWKMNQMMHPVEEINCHGINPQLNINMASRLCPVVASQPINNFDGCGMVSGNSLPGKYCDRMKCESPTSNDGDSLPTLSNNNSPFNPFIAPMCTQSTGNIAKTQKILPNNTLPQAVCSNMPNRNSTACKASCGSAFGMPSHTSTSLITHTNGNFSFDFKPATCQSTAANVKDQYCNYRPVRNLTQATYPYPNFSM